MNSNTDLGKDNIFKLLFKLSTPAIIAQLVNVLYNIIDRIFIGKMENGELAMAGVGIAFPIILIINSFSSLVGMGGAPLCAIKLGEGDNEGAKKIMNNGFSMLLLASLILTIFFSIFKENILIMFGASEHTLPYAVDYIGIYVLGTVFVQISLGMNSYINTQGFAKIGMMTVTLGAIINIILDPILIFGFGLGVKGAAIATIISQAVSALWVLKFLTGKKTTLKLTKNSLGFDKKITKSIASLGIAPFAMQATESLVIISLNSQLAKFGGDLAVGAMTIMSSINQLVLLPNLGFTQGSQPIISYNLGAKNLSRVRNTFKLTVLVCSTYTLIIYLLIHNIPEVFVSLFNNDPELMKITVDSIRIFFAGIIILGFQVSCQTTTLALGEAKISLFIATLRKVILLIPLIFILPNFFEDKMFAILVSAPIADFVTVIITAILFYRLYKSKLYEETSVISEKKA